MVYHFLLCLTTLIFDVFASIGLAPDEKDLQIALLRQQLRVLERKVKQKPRLSRPEKLMLVALTTRLQRQTQWWRERLREAVLLVQPETVLKWHRELVYGSATSSPTEFISDRVLSTKRASDGYVPDAAARLRLPSSSFRGSRRIPSADRRAP